MHSKISIRPAVSTEPTDNIVEGFQNETLRPILKLQHELFVKLFENYLDKRKQTFGQMAVEDRAKYIGHTLKTDQRFKQLLIGTVIGLFTDEEMANYLTNESESNRRIITMLIERLKTVFCADR